MTIGLLSFSFFQAQKKIARANGCTYALGDVGFSRRGCVGILDGNLCRRDAQA